MSTQGNAQKQTEPYPVLDADIKKMLAKVLAELSGLDH